MMRKNIQKGYALVTAMVVGVVAMSITSAVLLRMSSSTKQIVKREKVDQAMALTESVANTMLDAIAEISVDTDLDNDGNADEFDWGVYLSAGDLVQSIHGTDAGYRRLMDLVDASNQPLNQDSNTIKISELTNSGALVRSYPTSGLASTFINSLETNASHSPDFWRIYNKDDNSNFGAAFNGNSMAAILKDMHSQAQSVYRVERNGLEADVIVSLAPLATNISDRNDAVMHNSATFVEHHDVYHLQVTTQIPNMANPQETRRVEVIFQRPVTRENTTDPVFDHAILSDGDIDLGNKDTSAGDSATVIDSLQNGDVHTNGNLIIGSQGSVQGKATATGTVTINNPNLTLPTTDCTGPGAPPSCASPDPRAALTPSKIKNPGESKSGAEEVPLPEFDIDNLPSTPCPTSGSPLVLEDCTYSGSLPGGPKDIVIKGRVYFDDQFNVTGGNSTIKCEKNAAGNPCLLVAENGIDIGGNVNFNNGNEIEAIFYNKNGDINIRGGSDSPNSDHGNLFYNADPNGTIFQNGNTEFFGALISKGDVVGVGNASSFGIQRDSDMEALRYYLKPNPPEKEDLYPNIVSWQAVNVS